MALYVVQSQFFGLQMGCLYMNLKEHTPALTCDGQFVAKSLYFTLQIQVYGIAD